MSYTVYFQGANRGYCRDHARFRRGDGQVSRIPARTVVHKCGKEVACDICGLCAEHCTLHPLARRGPEPVPAEQCPALYQASRKRGNIPAGRADTVVVYQSLNAEGEPEGGETVRPASCLVRRTATSFFVSA